MIKWSEIPTTFKAITVIVAAVAAAITWHYATFQTVEAFEQYAEYEQQKDDRQLIYSIEQQIADYEEKISLSNDDKKIQWYEKQIKKLEAKLQCIRDGKAIC